MIFLLVLRARYCRPVLPVTPSPFSPQVRLQTADCRLQTNIPRLILTLLLLSVMRTTGQTTNKISKKLWRGQRSKSQSRGQSQISSPWSPPPPLDNKVRPVFSTLIGRGMSRLCSHWSRGS